MANPAPGFSRHPQHGIYVDTILEPVTVTIGGARVAETGRAVLMREDGYRDRVYIPREDVVAGLVPSGKTTYCPFKGETVYFDVVVHHEPLANAAWSYEEPYDEMRAIARHVCFDDSFEVTIG